MNVFKRFCINLLARQEHSVRSLCTHFDAIKMMAKNISPINTCKLYLFVCIRILSKMGKYTPAQWNAWQIVFNGTLHSYARTRNQCDGKMQIKPKQQLDDDRLTNGNCAHWFRVSTYDCMKTANQFMHDAKKECQLATTKKQYSCGEEHPMLSNNTDNTHAHTRCRQTQN